MFTTETPEGLNQAGGCLDWNLVICRQQGLKVWKGLAA